MSWEEDKNTTIIICLTFLVTLGTAAHCTANPVGDGAKYVLEKCKNPDWLSDKVLKYGFVATVCATNSLRMAREADEFDSRDLLGENSYHAIELGIIAGYVFSGYLLFAVLNRDTWRWKDRVYLATGTLCLARESGEFVYQGMRYGNPFNNNPDWHQNELPWFRPKSTFPFLRDDFISTGRISTPLTHIGFTALGANLIWRIK